MTRSRCTLSHAAMQPNRPLELPQIKWLGQMTPPAQSHIIIHKPARQPLPQLQLFPRLPASSSTLHPSEASPNLPRGKLLNNKQFIVPALLKSNPAAVLCIQSQPKPAQKRDGKLPV